MSLAGGGRAVWSCAATSHLPSTTTCPTPAGTPYPNRTTLHTLDALCAYLTPARGGLPRDWPQVTLTKPSTDERLDAALALDAAHAVSPDQRLLRVLLADDQSAFERALDERLAQHSAGVGENPAPGTLLPLGAIALVASFTSMGSGTSSVASHAA
ncbi:Imm49 family immunity protein [Streptomyces sp. CEV 2-1]|uniref:Imm49 family immunity protein n=1 Tax=Streptomyces sp. CEV 2-1 TaxID=2485153 RepID=UPI000F49EAC9|nr:Imm49 family immunity protein [Streptomyces sp. CEV 2-1]